MPSGRIAPLRSPASLVPDAHLPPVCLARDECGPAIDDVERPFGFDPAAVPYERTAAKVGRRRHPDAVGALSGSVAVVRRLVHPGEPGCDILCQRLGAVLARKPRRSDSGSAGGCCGQHGDYEYREPLHHVGRGFARPLFATVLLLSASEAAREPPGGEYQQQNEPPRYEAAERLFHLQLERGDEPYGGDDRHRGNDYVDYGPVFHRHIVLYRVSCRAVTASLTLQPLRFSPTVFDMALIWQQSAPNSAQRAKSAAPSMFSMSAPSAPPRRRLRCCLLRFRDPAAPMSRGSLSGIGCRQPGHPLFGLRPRQSLSATVRRSFRLCRPARTCGNLHAGVVPRMPPCVPCPRRICAPRHRGAPC